MVQPMPYVAVQSMIDGGNPWGIGEYFKVDYLTELPDEAIDTVIEEAAGVVSPFTTIILARLGGATDRTDTEAMALNAPKTKWFYFHLAMWMDPALAEGETAGARAFMKALEPWSAGKAPLNFISSDEGEQRLRASFGDAKFERLQALKDKYDPDNVFALNANIPPSGA